MYNQKHDLIQSRIVLFVLTCVKNKLFRANPLFLLGIFSVYAPTHISRRTNPIHILLPEKQLTILKDVHFELFI